MLLLYWFHFHIKMGVMIGLMLILLLAYSLVAAPDDGDRIMVVRNVSFTVLTNCNKAAATLAGSWLQNGSHVLNAKLKEVCRNRTTMYIRLEANNYREEWRWTFE